MSFKSTFSSAILLSTAATLVSANGFGQQPEAGIGYHTDATSNSTQVIDYVNWNTNMTLDNIYATSVFAVGGNAAADLGYSCVFASGGNPGGLHNISLHGPAANLATNPVQIKWICCGTCNVTAPASTSSASATTSGSATSTPAGNSTSPSNSASPSSSTEPFTGAGTMISPVGVAGLSAIAFGLLSFCL